ncbi:MAG: hypothetical protein WCZ66_10695 [Sphingomonadaceae bacterium]
MSERWSINADWAALEEGSPQECAGFATLGVRAYGTWLTAGHDRILQSVREAPYLSAYHLAEWLAWNWWRLRWEPRRASLEWELSHSMASIGGGYIWPNIHVVSDGESITLISRATPERARTPYRYINDGVSVIPAAEFESEVDLFVAAVLQRLQDRQVRESNLRDIWRSVTEERQDPYLRRQRKLEALLGEDPDEMDIALLKRFLDEIETAGEAALEEIAANRLPGQPVPDIAWLLNIGREQGVVTCAQDQVLFQGEVPRNLGAAWRIGAWAARSLRAQEDIAPDRPITDGQLAQMYGAPGNILETPRNPAGRLDLSFALSETAQHSRVMLRSPWKNSRRFELARLLGDALVYPTQDPMRPATRSDTYRQKVQRAFAAEFLSPFEAVKEMLDGDYSMERQQDVAHHFEVFGMTIGTHLVNNDLIDRSELDEPV